MTQSFLVLLQISPLSDTLYILLRLVLRYFKGYLENDGIKKVGRNEINDGHHTKQYYLPFGFTGHCRNYSNIHSQLVLPLIHFGTIRQSRRVVESPFYFAVLRSPSPSHIPLNFCLRFPWISHGL